jgi:hypothetical protein
VLAVLAAAPIGLVLLLMAGADGPPPAPERSRPPARFRSPSSPSAPVAPTPRTARGPAPWGCSRKPACPWGELDVDTSDEPPWGDGAADDYWLISGWLHRAVDPERLTFPITITADRWERNVLVDGLPTRFAFVGNDTTWSAYGTVEGRQVGVSGTGWPHDRLTLVTVAPGEVSEEVPDRP